MSADLALEPIGKPFDVKITPPGSKSLTNRALVLGALSDGVSDLSNVLFADDTLVMIECLTKLGFHLHVERDEHFVRIHGRGGKIDRNAAQLFCGNSGTTLRFLTALCTLGHGTYSLDGVPRMRQRPIGPLVDLLRNLGARVEYVMDEGFPPVRVIADALPGGLARFGASQSSQYLSALLMVAPHARNEIRIDLAPPLTSWPYVAMTMQLMDQFGETCELIRDPRSGLPKQIIIPQGHYQPTSLTIEPDATAASYFLAAAAINEGSKVTIEGLGKASLQGDVGFADVLHKMGASLVFGKDFITLTGTDAFEGIDIDLANMPDTAQTLAVVCLFAQGESTIRGLHTLRHKETDRLAALATELQKMGAAVTIEADDGLHIEPPEHVMPATIDTYDDHRMAMSFAVASTKVPLVIRGPECVNKTYPDFFKDLSRLGT
jgi:3-phosphoshikimate 1-carboxyvinyltransferase